MPLNIRADLGAVDQTLKQFVEGIVDDYHNARSTLNPHPKLSRGVSRIISSATEERLAHYLINRHGDIDHIYLDQGISTPDQKLTKPDLVICKNHAIKMLIDVKMDLGHKRTDFVYMLKSASSYVQSVSEKSCWVNAREGNTRRKENLSFSKNLHYVFFVISGQNIQAENFQSLEEEAKEHSTHVSLITLIRNGHPNESKISIDCAKQKMLSEVNVHALQQLSSIVEEHLL